MQLFVHAGTHKTATTSFQKLCDANRARLAAAGLSYPAQRGWTQHSYLAWMLQARADDELLGLLRRYREAAAQAGCDRVLISGEDLENGLVDTHQLALFQRLAARAGFAPPRWIVVHRPPQDYLESIYSEKSKHGVVLNMAQLLKVTAKTGFFSVSTANYNYRFVLDVPRHAALCRAETGAEIELLPFARFLQGFPGRCLLARWLPPEVLSALDAEAAALGQQNRRLDPRLVERLYACGFLGTKMDSAYAQGHEGLLAHLVEVRMQHRAAAEQEHRPFFERLLRRH